MRIAAHYSHLNGLEYLLMHQPRHMEKYRKTPNELAKMFGAKKR